MSTMTTYSCIIKHFKGDVYLKFGKYSNKRIAIEVIDTEDDGKICTATVNIPGAKLFEGEIIIKNYSENTGILGFLQHNNIVGDVLRTVACGYERAYIVKLLISQPHK